MTYLPLLLLLTCPPSLPQQLQYLGSVMVDRPAFPALYDHGQDTIDPAQRYSIVLSTFVLEEPDVERVYFVRHPGTCLDQPDNCSLEVVADDLRWPRQPGQVPESAFGSADFVYITDGFIPPPYKDGAVYIADYSSPGMRNKTDITRAPGDRDWFYQQVTWKDADGDGLLDAFTCRTNIQTIPSAVSSEFLWLKNPGGAGAPYEGPWEVGHVISENDCDTFMAETRLSAGGVEYDVIFTTGYFMDSLSVYWSAEGVWDNSTRIESRVLGSLIADADCTTPGQGNLCGHFFDLMVADLNLDGRLDLLVSINSELYGHLIVYEIPDDFRTDPFEPIILAEGFIPRIGAANQGAPGLLQIFQPTPSMTGRPWIGLSGDDDGKSYYLRPVSEDTDSWLYDLVEVIDGGPDFTMGGPLVFDADNDGYMEWFQLVYSGNEIRFYTFVD